MHTNTDLQKDALRLQRKILNGYWIVIVVSVIAVVVAFFIRIQLEQDNLGEFLIKTVTIPTTVQIVLVVINEYVDKHYKQPRPYTIILTGIVIGAVIIYGNPTVIGIQFVMMLPMLVAAFQFNKKYLTFAYVMLYPTLATIYLLYPAVWDNMSIYERFVLFYILTGEYLILIQLLQRGVKILDRLVQISESERELIIKNTVMEQLSKTDALTHLYNHRTFQEYLDTMIEHFEKNKVALQLAIIDIDNFKHINDNYGHAVGDDILKEVARVLQQTFTSDNIIARYGGEEFAILFPAKTLDEAYKLCEKARVHVEQIKHNSILEHQVTVSIGLSTYHCNLDKGEFFAQTDRLLYLAKRSGKNKTMYSI